MAAVRPGFNHKAVFILSVFQLSCGALAALFGIIQIVIGTELNVVGYGIWTGLFFIVAGILGITSWKYKNNCNIVGHMVMSIIACVFGWMLLGFAAASIGVNASGHYGNDYSRNGGYSYNRIKYCFDFRNNYGHFYGDCAGPLALGSLLLIISLLEIVVSIVSCVYCCKAVCCGTRSHGQTQGNTVQYVVSPGGGPPGQQVVVMGSGSYPQQGYVMYPGQQPMYQMQGSVPQGGQIVVNQPAYGQTAYNAQVVPQGQIAYNAQAVPQGQIAYNTQAVPQGQIAYNTQAVPQGQIANNTQAVPQGQIAYNVQSTPQSQTAYNVQSIPQGQTAYNVQSIPQGQTTSNAPAGQPAVVPTQNATPVSPPAYMALDRTQTQDGQNYDYVRINDSAENEANN